jgi:hypothetical protein
MLRTRSGRTVRRESLARVDACPRFDTDIVQPYRAIQLGQPTADKEVGAIIDDVPCC